MIKHVIVVDRYDMLGYFSLEINLNFQHFILVTKINESTKSN
jgi:hypothetical protein